MYAQAKEANRCEYYTSFHISNLMIVLLSCWDFLINTFTVMGHHNMTWDSHNISFLPLHLYLSTGCAWTFWLTMTHFHTWLFPVTHSVDSMRLLCYNSYLTCHDSYWPVYIPASSNEETGRGTPFAPNQVRQFKVARHDWKDLTLISLTLRNSSISRSERELTRLSST